MLAKVSFKLLKSVGAKSYKASTKLISNRSSQSNTARSRGDRGVTPNLHPYLSLTGQEAFVSCVYFRQHICINTLQVNYLLHVSAIIKCAYSLLAALLTPYIFL
jgi:hypothetical protein